MRFQVSISLSALARLENHIAYIADDQKQPFTAERWLRKALKAVETLQDFPHRCPIAPENSHFPFTVRMLIVDSCLFLYRVDDVSRVVRVLDFRHACQLPSLDDAAVT